MKKSKKIVKRLIKFCLMNLPMWIKVRFGLLKKSKAIVVFSGGQDSTTCLAWALKRFDEVEAMTFNYGQKHSIELRQAQTICAKLSVRQTLIDISFLNQITESALLSSQDVNEMNEKGLPASFVPNRNMIFLTLAHSYAQKVNADTLVIGACETDFSGYPDCRQVFINAAEDTLNLSSDSDIKIDAPLMYLNKAQTFELADQLDMLQFVIEHSHTCYNGDRKTRHDYGYGCDECPSCDLRRRGYEQFINQLNSNK